MFSRLQQRCNLKKNTHTGRHIEKQWRLLLFHSTEKKNCCDIGVNHWAETNIHTVPLKWWLAQWSCKAWGRLRHVHTHTLVCSLGQTLTHTPTHPHTPLHLHQLSYTCGCSNSNRFTIPPSNVVSQRGEGSRVTFRFVFPAFAFIRGYFRVDRRHNTETSAVHLYGTSAKQRDPQQ